MESADDPASFRQPDFRAEISKTLERLRQRENVRGGRSREIRHTATGGQTAASGGSHTSGACADSSNDGGGGIHPAWRFSSVLRSFRRSASLTPTVRNAELRRMFPENRRQTLDSGSPISSGTPSRRTATHHREPMWFPLSKKRSQRSAFMRTPLVSFERNATSVSRPCDGFRLSSPLSVRRKNKQHSAFRLVSNAGLVRSFVRSAEGVDRRAAQAHRHGTTFLWN